MREVIYLTADEYGIKKIKEHVITEEEAGIIRRARTEKMIAILGEQGYQITKQGEDS